MLKNSVKVGTIENIEEIANNEIRLIDSYISSDLTQFMSLEDTKLSEYKNNNNVYYDSETKEIYFYTGYLIDTNKFPIDAIRKVYELTTSEEIIIDNYNIPFFEEVLGNPHIKLIRYELLDSKFLNQERLDKIVSAGKKVIVKNFSSDVFEHLGSYFEVSSKFYDDAYLYQAMCTARLDSPILKEDFAYLDSTLKIIIMYYHPRNIIDILEYLKSISYTGDIFFSYASVKDLSFAQPYMKDLRLLIDGNGLDKCHYGNDQIVDVEVYEKTRSQLECYVKSLKESTLSPFERYIYLYNLVKNFKSYRDNLNDVNASRSIYRILDNEYMVCGGYANLLNNLCEMAGIPCAYVNCEIGEWMDEQIIDIGDKIFTKYPKILQEFLRKHQIIYGMLVEFLRKSYNENYHYAKSYHARNYLHIVDEKWGLDGFYYADATWDVNKNADLYTHLAMTDDENDLSCATFYMDYMSLFDIKSEEEFYRKLEHFSSMQPFLTLVGILQEFMITLKVLDLNFYEYICEKYTIYRKKEFDTINPSLIDEFLRELANYVLSKVNKTIPGEIKYRAILNSLEKQVGYEIDPDYMNQLRLWDEQVGQQKFYQSLEEKNNHIL